MACASSAASHAPLLLLLLSGDFGEALAATPPPPPPPLSSILPVACSYNLSLHSAVRWEDKLWLSSEVSNRYQKYSTVP